SPPNPPLPAAGFEGCRGFFRQLPAAGIEGSPPNPSSRQPGRCRERPGALRTRSVRRITLAAGDENRGEDDVPVVALGLGRLRFETPPGSVAEDEAVRGGDEARALERGAEGRLGGGKTVDARDDESPATRALDEPDERPREHGL